jgi:hypothetical protein
MKTHFLVSLFAAVSLNSLALAEKAPLSVEALQTQADAIVLATIQHIRVESEPSRFEPAIGNSDWGIYLTLRLETVEKGSVSGDELEVRCFRIRNRRSAMTLEPSGHHPIPATGTRVRAYLEMRGNLWHVVLPNGLTPLDGKTQDAIEVTQLGNRADTDTLPLERGYTYLLPIEIWILLLIVGIPIVTCLALMVRRYKKRQLHSENHR